MILLNDEILKVLGEYILEIETLNKRKNYLNTDIELSYTHFHILDFIEENENVTNIVISKSFNLTRGAVTKILNKLSNNQLICSKLVNNKKQFHLTPLGKEYYVKHKEIRQQSINNYHNLLSRYDEKEKRAIYDFLSGLVKEMKY